MKYGTVTLDEMFEIMKGEVMRDSEDSLYYANEELLSKVNTLEKEKQAMQGTIDELNELLKDAYAKNDAQAEDIRTLKNKLMEVSPDLVKWIEKNFGGRDANRKP